MASGWEGCEKDGGLCSYHFPPHPAALSPRLTAVLTLNPGARFLSFLPFAGPNGWLCLLSRWVSMERCNRLPGLPQRRPPRLALAAAKVSIPRVLAPALGCFLSPTRPDKGQGPWERERWMPWVCR